MFLPLQVKQRSRQMPTMGQFWQNVGARLATSSQVPRIDPTPSFSMIAQKADFSAEKLAFFLLEPHPCERREGQSDDVM